MNRQDAARLMGMASFPDGWEFHPVFRSGALAGFFCTMQNEIHAFRLPEFKGRWLTRQAIEAVITPLFDKYQELSTIVRENNDTGHEFVQRLGFAPCGSDERGVRYTTKKVKHARL